MVEPEKVHDKLFKGTDRPFCKSKRPERAVAQYNAVSKKKSTFEKRVKRQSLAMKKLKSIGYEVSLKYANTNKVCYCRIMWN